ncbi:MAG TPA: histidine kinase [Jiangellaceae bacterium]|nr:histidine kinase [Jiangellaceae bacterium]
MAVRSVLSPLVSGSTYRRGVYLLLGGVLLLPYVLLGVAFTQLLLSDSPRALSLLLLGLAAVIACAPAFLGATRTLETTAARTLLEVDLPDPVADPPPLETRLRSALWFAVHLASGGVVALVMLLALPMTLAFIAAQFGLGAETLAGIEFGPLDQDDTVARSLLGLVILVGLAYAVAGLGRLAAIMAPVLLGPSPAERIAALEAETDQLVERNRLARELHDTIGHALTVTTLQAAAAGEVVDSDPEFVRRALKAVEETGRAAMSDLDYALGLLRDGDAAARSPSRPASRTLADLDRLVAESRAAGAAITSSLNGALSRVPAIVSREGYRIVQESLTNAARHATGQPVTLRLAVADDLLTIDVANPVQGEQTPPEDGHSGGRGLAGMRERVALLGGQMAAGRENGEWRVTVRLPLGGRRIRRPA